MQSQSSSEVWNLRVTILVLRSSNSSLFLGGKTFYPDVPWFKSNVTNYAPVGASLHRTENGSEPDMFLSFTTLLGDGLLWGTDGQSSLLDCPVSEASDKRWI